MLGSLVSKRKKCKVLGFQWCLHNCWMLKQFLHFCWFFKNKIKDLGTTLWINLLCKRLEFYDALKIKSFFMVVNWGLFWLTLLCCYLILVVMLLLDPSFSSSCIVEWLLINSSYNYYLIFFLLLFNFSLVAWLCSCCLALPSLSTLLT